MRAELSALRPALAWLRRLEDALLVLILAAIIGVAAYQVAARNLFDTGLLWGDALVRVLVIWVAMVGAMVASRSDDHIRIDLAARFAPARWRPWLARFANGFTCAVLGVFAWFSLEFVRFEHEDGMIAFGAVPAWLCEAILPLGAAVMCLRYLLHALAPR